MGSPYRERGKAVGAAVVERDPLAGPGVLPDDEVAVEELERGGAAGVEVLDEGDRVPVIPPGELLPRVRRRRRRARLRPLRRLTGGGRRRRHAQAGAGTACAAGVVAGGRGRGERAEPRRPRCDEERWGGCDRRAHFLRLVSSERRGFGSASEILAGAGFFNAPAVAAESVDGWKHRSSAVLLLELGENRVVARQGGGKTSRFWRKKTSGGSKYFLTFSRLRS